MDSSADPRGRGRGGGGGGGRGGFPGGAPMYNAGNTGASYNQAGWEETPVECIICAGACRALCVFPCGHFTCYSCGLRIHTLNKGSCPVCRKEATEMPIVTRLLSREEEQYSADEMANMRRVVTVDQRLRCVIDSPQLAVEVAKLYEYTCPMEGCWCQGHQDPFVAMGMLKDHLRVDHDLGYCEVCLQHRPAFLCEQVAYSPIALSQHAEGQCRHDSSSFTGHPPCRFCKRANRFYDGEALLKHMQKDHYTCDVCNRGQYTFTFYATRQKLDQHFTTCHKICDHPDCASLDLMLRVFGNEIDLMVHKQRVHGVKAKMSFSPAMFGEASSSSGGSGPSGAVPATASNMNVIQIRFDHVFRIETVDMLPGKSNQHRGGGRRGGGGGGGGAEKVHAPEENGIPPYYLNSSALPVLMRYSAAAGVAAPPTGRPGGARGFGGGGGNNNSRQGNHHNEPSTSAFGVAEDMSNYNIKNRLPTDKRQLEQRLNDLLSRHLTSPVAYGHFRGYTRDFINGAIMTSEYYDMLSRECFPDSQVFHQVFPLVVATVPVPEKQSALQEVYKMRMAPEIQRIARAREEDARKEAEAQAAAARAEEQRSRNAGRSNNNGGPNHHNSITNTNSSGGGGGGGVLNATPAPAGAPSPFRKSKGRGGKQNAWLTSDTRTKFGGATTSQHQDPSSNANATSPTTSSPTSNNAAASLRPQATSTQLTWGAAASASSGPPAASSVPGSSPTYGGRGLVINEETFPSLPSTGIRRAPIGKAQQSKGNAWFSR